MASRNDFRSKSGAAQQRVEADEAKHDGASQLNSVLGGPFPEPCMPVTDELARRALGERDWPTVQAYVLGLLESDPTHGAEWLERLEASARGPAIDGDKYAQSVMGGIETWRGLWNLAPAAESLERALE